MRTITTSDKKSKYRTIVFVYQSRNSYKYGFTNSFPPNLSMYGIESHQQKSTARERDTLENRCGTIYFTSSIFHTELTELARFHWILARSAHRCDGVRCWFWKHSILHKWHDIHRTIHTTDESEKFQIGANVATLFPSGPVHIYIGPFSPIVGTHLLRARSVHIILYNHCRIHRIVHGCFGLASVHVGFLPLSSWFRHLERTGMDESVNFECCRCEMHTTSRRSSIFLAMFLNCFGAFIFCLVQFHCQMDPIRNGKSFIHRHWKKQRVQKYNIGLNENVNPFIVFVSDDVSIGVIFLRATFQYEPSFRQTYRNGRKVQWL